MKCLVIHGSPRRGNTWDVLNRVKDVMDKYGDFKWDTVELSKEKIPSCVGCFNCIYKGEDKCPHNSIMEGIINKIDEADILIITSPVYSLGVTGTLKNFIDHMSFKFHRPSYFTKKALVVTTTAGAGHKDVADYIKSTLTYWGFNYVKTLPIAYRNVELTEKNIKKIEMEAKNFVLELRKNRLNKPNIKSVMMFNTWKAMSLNGDKDSADYKYWDNLKLKDNVYSEEIPVNFIEKVIGRFAYKMMKNNINQDNENVKK